MGIVKAMIYREHWMNTLHHKEKGAGSLVRRVGELQYRCGGTGYTVWAGGAEQQSPHSRYNCIRPPAATLCPCASAWPLTTAHKGTDRCFK
ncbi:hypothetical protein scyTo_0004886 [Scyliorhinus torazame]|uniref:Uncharacterized protein n=1 Tax=Scyliorhinus torazame TaxID=75743 RepID=A0A401NYN6_SCYTO|nr:hypothetical protein [Scyliorhinus torazame]